MEGARVLQQLIQENDIYVAELGTIIDYDYKSNTATIQLLVQEDDEDLPLLINVPVMTFGGGTYHIITDRSLNELVVVLFLNRDSDNTIMTGTKSIPNSQRKHSLDDAIAIGGIMPLNKTNSYVPNGFIVTGRNTTFQMDKDNNISLYNENGKLRIDRNGDIHLSSQAGEIKAGKKGINIVDGNSNISIRDKGEIRINNGKGSIKIDNQGNITFSGNHIQFDAKTIGGLEKYENSKTK